MTSEVEKVPVTPGQGASYDLPRPTEDESAMYRYQLKRQAVDLSLRVHQMESEKKLIAEEESRLLEDVQLVDRGERPVHAVLDVEGTDEAYTVSDYLDSETDTADVEEEFLYLCPAENLMADQQPAGLQKISLRLVQPQSSEDGRGEPVSTASLKRTESQARDSGVGKSMQMEEVTQTRAVGPAVKADQPSPRGRPRMPETSTPYGFGAGTTSTPSQPGPSSASQRDPAAVTSTATPSQPQIGQPQIPSATRFQPRRSSPTASPGQPQIPSATRFQPRRASPTATPSQPQIPAATRSQPRRSSSAASPGQPQASAATRFQSSRASSAASPSQPRSQPRSASAPRFQPRRDAPSASRQPGPTPASTAEEAMSTSADEWKQSQPQGQPQDEDPANRRPQTRLFTREQVERMLAANAAQAREQLEGERAMAERMMNAAVASAPANQSAAQLSQQLVERIEEKKQESSPRKRKDVLVGSFGDDPDQDWLDYLGQFKTCSRHNHWDDTEEFQQMVVHLKGDALALYTDHQPKTYQDLVALLSGHYTPEGSEESYKMKFRNRRLKEKEDPDTYSRELTRLARRAYPAWDQKAVDEQVLDQFKTGLTDPEMRRHVALGKFDTLREAVAAASKYLRYEEGAQLHVSKPKSARLAAAPSRDDDESPEVQTVMRELERQSGVLGKVLTTVTQWPEVRDSRGMPRNTSGRFPRRPMRCWACKKEGHSYQRCPDNKDGSYRPTPEQRQLQEASRQKAQARAGAQNFGNRPTPVRPAQDGGDRSGAGKPLN